MEQQEIIKPENEENSNEEVNDGNPIPPSQKVDEVRSRLFLIFGALIITGAIFLGWLFFNNITPSVANLSAPTPLSIAHIENPKSFQYFKFVLPAPSKNIVRCEQYQSYETRVKCWQSLSVLNKNASYCNNIEPSFQTGLMHRDTCFDLVARETKDASLCEGIVNKDALTGDYIRCVASITGDISKCPVLDPDNDYNGAYNCYLSLAATTGEISVCDEFKDNLHSKRTCYAGVAVEKKDSSVCGLDSLEDEVRDDCYMAYLSGLGVIDTSVCSRIVSEERQSRCLSIMERKTIARDNNITACNDISDKDKRGSCFWEVAKVQDNPVLCEEVPDELWVGQCILQSSAAMKDSTACEALTGSNYDRSNRDLCLFHYGTINQKPESCGKISNPDSRSFCLEQISAETAPISNI